MKKGSGWFGYAACLVIGCVVGVKYVEPMMHSIKTPTLPTMPSSESVTAPIKSAMPSTVSVPTLTWRDQKVPGK